MADNSFLDLQDVVGGQPQRIEADSSLMDLSEIVRRQPRDGNEDYDNVGIDSQLKKRKLDRYASDTKDRAWLAKWTAITVTIWLAAVLSILFLNAILNLHLSDTVLITLLGTTTLNVLGLPFIVLRGHFLGKKEGEN